MFTRTLTTALVSGILLTGFAPTHSFANEGGGGGGGGETPMVTVHNPDGSLVTSRRNPDGSRTITEHNASGDVTREERIERKKPGKKAGKKPGRKPRARSLPWAQSFDPHTGQSVGSYGNPDGSRAVISIGPLGFSFTISN